MSTSAFQIDKAGAAKVLITSGWVGLAAALTYLASNLDPAVWGASAPLLGAGLAILTKLLTQWALPTKGSPAPKTIEVKVGSDGLPLDRLEDKAGEVVKAFEMQRIADRTERLAHLFEKIAEKKEAE